MKKIFLAVWNYYLTMGLVRIIPQRVFFQRLRRFIKSKKNKIQIREIYDFFFLQILKQDFLKWAKFFEENKFSFK